MARTIKSWRQETYRLQAMQRLYGNKIQQRCLQAWLRHTKEKQRRREVFDDFRTTRTGRILRTVFIQWREMQRQREDERESKNRRLEEVVRAIVVRWRQRALQSRGQDHYARNLLNKVSQCYQGFVCKGYG